MRARLFPIFVCLFAVSPLSAQTGMTGGQQSGGGPETRQSSPGPRELLESGGRWLTDGLRNLTGGGGESERVWDSNGSPRETVLTFVEGMGDLTYRSKDTGAVVAKTLPSEFTAESRETKALLGVFERLGQLAPTDLPNRASAEEKGLKNFQVFPYAVDHEWLWEQLGEAPTGEIWLSKNDSGEWRFTPDTLSGAPDLLDSMRSVSPVYGDKKGSELITRTFGGMFADTPWWGWLIFVGVSLAAVFAGIFLHRGIKALRRKFELGERSVTASLLRSLSTALCIFVATVIFVLGSSAIQFTPTIAEMYWGLVRAILLIGAVWVLFGLTDLVATLVRTHFIPDSNEYGEMAVTIAQRIFRSVLFVILVIFILENLLGINIGALIVGFGIVGLALSLAGKEMAQNLFGAVSIFLNRPFVVGDWVSFKDEVGVIDDVRMQATYIRLLSGEMLIVPNMQFISNAVENLSLRKYLRRQLDLSIPYGTTPKKLEEAISLLREVLTGDDICEDAKIDPEERAPVVSFRGFESYYLHILVYHWYQISEDGDVIQRNDERGWFSYLEHCTLVNTKILKAFDEAEIEFAFPTQTVHVPEAEKSGGGEKIEALAG